MIGTAPNFQKQGFGGAIMNGTFNYAQARKVPCYLEVVSEQSKIVHLKKGYKILTEFDLPDSLITVTTMLNELDR